MSRTIINLVSISIVLSLLAGCVKPTEVDLESRKKEILQTEKDFDKMAAEKGIEAAFLHYAADDAVLQRGSQLVVGRKAIEERFKTRTGMENSTMTWTPDFVDVSGDGNMGYTYGHYIFTLVNTDSSMQHDTGIFHTVWKRKPDGRWNFVWD